MRFARESESPVVPRASQESINLREGRGDTFVMFLKEGRNEGIATCLKPRRRFKDRNRYVLM